MDESTRFQSPRFWQSWRTLRRAEEVSLSENETLSPVSKRLLNFNQDVEDWLIAMSHERRESKAYVHRYVPISIRVLTREDEISGGVEVYDALWDFLHAAGLNNDSAFDPAAPVFSSLFFDGVFRTNSPKSGTDLEKRLTLIEKVLVEAFEAQGEKVTCPDRAAMKRMAAKEETEIKKLNAETLKIRAEALKTLSECALNLVKILLRASAAFAFTIGTVQVVHQTLTGNVKEALVKPITAHVMAIQKLSPEEMMRMWDTVREMSKQKEERKHDSLP